MSQVTVTFNDTFLQELLDAWAWKYPIPQIPDPVNPPNTMDEFAKGQWLKESLKRKMRRVHAEHRTYLAQIAVAVPEVPDLVEIT